MKRTIAKKDTSSRSKSKFAGVIGSKIWPTCTTKYSKRLIIWFFSKEKFSRGAIVDDSTRQNINKICSSQESLIPKFKRHGGISKKSKPTSTM
jgi:hypothetical protein